MKHIKEFQSYTGPTTSLLEKMGVSMAVDSAVNEILDRLLSDKDYQGDIKKVIAGYKNDGEPFSNNTQRSVILENVEVEGFKIKKMQVDLMLDIDSKYDMDWAHTGTFLGDTFSVDEDKEAMFVVQAFIHTNPDIWNKAVVDGTIQEDVRRELNGVLEHEMTHAYESYRRNEKSLAISDAKDAIYAGVSTALRQAFKVKNPVINEEVSKLLFYIYYVASFEMNAKVAESWPLLKTIKDPHDRLDALKKTDTWKIVNSIRNYDADALIEKFYKIIEGEGHNAEESLNGIFMTILNQFIEGDKETLLGGDNLIKYILNPDMLDKKMKMHKSELAAMDNDYRAFLHFWEKRFHRSGEEMYRRLSKLTTLDTDE